MLVKILKISLFIGILITSLTILATRIIPPSKMLLIFIFYMIILSSVASALAIYFEIYVKPKKQAEKINKIVFELKKIVLYAKKRMDYMNKIKNDQRQVSFMLEKSLQKLEEKIEKIEKEIMDMSMC